jgi:O-antigen/teichoic acid export membrane protein
MRLGKDSAIYGLSGAAIQIVGLLTLPIYARAFTPAEYGVVEVAMVTFTAMIVAADAGLGFAMQRNFYGDDDTDEHRRVVTSTATLGSTGLGLLVMVPLVLAREPIAEALLGDASYADVVALVGVAVPAGTLAVFLRDIMRLRFRAGHFAVSTVLSTAVTAAVGVVWVTAYDGGVSAVAWGLLAGQVVGVLYGFLIVHADVAPRFSWKEARALLLLGLPLIPAGAALWGMSFVDRLMLSQLDGLAATGEYAVGTRFAAVLLFFTGALGTAYTPFLFSLHASDPAAERALRVRLLTYASVFFIGVGLALALFAREITALIAPGYDNAYEVVGILCLGAAAFGLTPITGAGISIAKRTDLALKYTTVAVTINLVLCVALIPGLGAVGAAIAMAVPFALLAYAYLRRSQTLDDVRFHVSRTVRVFLLGGTLMSFGFLELSSTGLEILVKLLALVGFAVGVWLLRILDHEERDEIRRLVERLRHRSPAPAA